VPFTLPAAAHKRHWEFVLDTFDPKRAEGTRLKEQAITVEARSLVLLREPRT
jgi:hypothetical protein